MGQIIRIESGKILSPRPLKSGYQRVQLSSDSGERKDVLIHRIVCMTFNGNPPPGRECVNHKNANKSDNRPSNLEWCSYRENMAHASKNHLLESQKKHMRKVNLERRKHVVGRNEAGDIVYDYPRIQDAHNAGHSSVSYCLKKNIITKRGIKWEIVPK